MTVRLGTLARQHWFYLLLPILLLTALAVRPTMPWSTQPRLAEAVYLLDWCLVVPLLYLACYRRRPRRALALRLLALACGGVWIAGHLVPAEAQSLLAGAGWLRGAGLAVLLAFEGAAMLAVLRLVHGGGEPDPAELVRHGVPPVLARLMLAEARFWRRVGRWLRGR